MARRAGVRFAAVVALLVACLAAVAVPAGAASSNAAKPKDLRLAFINGFSVPQDVFAVGGRGGPMEQVTDIGEILQLAWSPTGNRLAVQVLPFGTLVVLNPDGTHGQIV